jgi:hypothetical protein
LEPDEYCRQIEAYLCQRNEGHLVRVAGPGFEKVKEWAGLGIPLKVVFRGIDRHVERAAANGPRRRPVRIEFCEADVLDAFDRWRRAVGLRPAASEEDAAAGTPAAPSRGRHSLPGHIDRVIARLTSMRAASALPGAWDRVLEQAVRDLDVVRAGADKLRGQAREEAIARLAVIDAQLTEAARGQTGTSLQAEIERDARAELEPFAARLTGAAYDAALSACRDRLVRDALGLPVVSFE